MLMGWFDRSLKPAEEELPQYPVESWTWNC